MGPMRRLPVLALLAGFTACSAVLGFEHGYLRPDGDAGDAEAEAASDASSDASDEATACPDDDAGPPPAEPTTGTCGSQQGIGLRRDPAYWGSCSRDCLGAKCVNSLCVATPVASDNDSFGGVRALTFHDGVFYWAA